MSDHGPLPAPSDLAWPDRPYSPRRRWLWPMLGLAAVLLVIGGGVAAALLLSRPALPAAEAAIDIPVITTPGSPSAGPASPSSLAVPVRLVVPPKLAGYPRYTSPETERELAAAREQLAATAVGDVVTGVYGDPAKRQLRMFAAYQATTLDQAATLDGIPRALRRAGASIATDFAEVPAGPLGGTARCGDVVRDRTTMAICIWVDGQTVGQLTFYFVEAKTIKDVFIQARGEIEIAA